MDTSALLKALSDPMGDPMYAVVFQVLMVLTFSLHLLMVNATVGAAGLAVAGRVIDDGHWRRLGAAMAKAVTMSVSALIVLGVAPLLFVQVVYEPFWYASNSLSAAWSIGFVFVMMAAFGLSYASAAREGKSGSALAAAAVLALFVLAGALMHVFSWQGLQPERWFSWYEKAGAVDASGFALHSFSLPRFLHFMVPCVALGGVFLTVYAWYLGPRADADKAYLDWTARLGAALAFWATAAQVAVGFWWLLSTPSALGFAWKPAFLIGAGAGVVLLGLLARTHFSPEPPQERALQNAGASLVAVLAMCAAREALRMGYVGRFAYSIYERRVSLDWGSTALFLGTFVLGLSVLSWLLATAFQAGRVAGRWEAPPRMQAWGRVSIGLLVAWVVVVAGLGVVITVRNLG